LTSNAAPRLTAMLHDDDVGGNAASSANASQSWRRSRLSARRIAVDGTAPAPIPTAWSVWNKGLLGLGKQTNKPYRVHLSDYADHRFSCWGRADSHAPANRAHAIQSNRQTEGGCRETGMADGVCTCKRTAGVHGLLLLERRHAQAGGGARIAAWGRTCESALKI
jgi:hypothetical protein